MPGRAERIVSARVSGRYADVYHVRAQAGRWIDEADNEDGDPEPVLTRYGLSFPRAHFTLGANVVVISDRIWREWFKAAPGAVNQFITLNRRPVRVIGVAPAGFDSSADVWAPYGRRRLLTREELDRQRAARSAEEAARAAAAQHLHDCADRAGPELEGRGGENAGRCWLRERRRQRCPRAPSNFVHGHSDNRVGRTGYVILGFAALIFVAACANLGNMLFARATEREGELAVRFSLGASRGHIFEILFSETVLICATAAGVGLALAVGALRLFSREFPAFQFDYWKRVTLALSLDWRVFSFAAGAGVLAALIVGAASLWRSNRVSLLTRLAAAGHAVVAKTEGRTLRTMLVSVQVTAAVLLLIATGMLLENSSEPPQSPPVVRHQIRSARRR